MKKYILIAIMFLNIAFISCNKSEDSVYKMKAIVEAYLAPDATVGVRITSEIAYNATDSAQGIENLNVIISCNQINYTLIETGNGYYYSNTLLKITPGNTYNLQFEYNDETISATTTIPDKPQNFTQSASSIVVQQFDPGSTTMPTFPEPIELNWYNPNHDYYIIVVQNIEETLVPTDTVNENRPAFRSEPIQSNTYTLQAMQFKYYGTHNVILFKLNAEYAALYNDNGSNSLNLTSPESNINNGWGIFTGINADTLQIEVTN